MPGNIIRNNVLMLMLKFYLVFTYNKLNNVVKKTISCKCRSVIISYNKTI